MKKQTSRFLLITLAFTCCWLFTDPISAEETSEEAKAAFDQGKVLFVEGKYEEAAKAFRKANELRPNWRLLFNIAQSEAAAKHPGLALQAFEAYLAQGGDELTVERREMCVQEVEQLRAMVGEVDVTAPDGAIVFVDGAERDRAPLPGPMMVAAGLEHQIRIELDGAVILERSVRVSSGKRIKVMAKTETDIGPSPEDDTTPDEKAVEGVDEKKNPLVVSGWVSMITGAALLVGGGITGGMVLSLDSDLDGTCQEGVCSESERQDVERLDTLALTTDVLIGVGVAAVITGVVLLIVGKRKSKEAQTDIAARPLLGPEFRGFGIEGRF